MFLTPDDIKILTGYQKPSYQRRELCKQGIPYKKRHDGFPVVRESVVGKRFKSKQLSQSMNIHPARNVRNPVLRSADWDNNLTYGARRGRTRNGVTAGSGLMDFTFQRMRKCREGQQCVKTQYRAGFESCRPTPIRKERR